MTKVLWRCAVACVVACLTLPAFAFAAEAADFSANQDTGSFSAKDRQADLARLRDFVYPKGYSEQDIVSLENGQVPTDLPVTEYARLHCGETSNFVLNPCIVRYGRGEMVGYIVVAQDATKRFAKLNDAVAYYREHVSDTASHLEMEISTMNTFVEDFCTQIAAGVRASDILSARGGDHPRISHPIARPDPNAKYQFSNLFSWERCEDCVGIVAVNQPEEAPPPSCGKLRKQGIPHIAYFVVDRNTSKGHRSLDDSINDFMRLASAR